MTVVVALAVVVVVAGAGVIGWTVLERRPTAPTSASAPVAATVLDAPAPDAPSDRARDVLRRWDARRMAAWAAGDVDRLQSLYAGGSPAGAHDAAMLQRWNRREVRMVGWSTQVLALDVVRARADLLVVRVVDRVVGAVAADGVGRARLPADRPSRRRVELRRGDRGPWRVVSVRVV